MTETSPRRTAGPPKTQVSPSRKTRLQSTESDEDWARATREVARKGFLVKQGGRVKSWKRRYFVLSNQELKYFKNDVEATPLGDIPFDETWKAVPFSHPKLPYAFHLFSAEALAAHTAKRTVLVRKQSRHLRVFLLVCESSEQLKAWVDDINTVIAQMAWKKAAQKSQSTSEPPLTAEQSKQQAEEKEKVVQDVHQKLVAATLVALQKQLEDRDSATLKAPGGRERRVPSSPKITIQPPSEPRSMDMSPFPPLDEDDDDANDREDHSDDAAEYGF